MQMIYTVLGRELQSNLNTAVLGLMTCAVTSYDFLEVFAAPVYRRSNSQTTRLHKPGDRNVFIAISPYLLGKTEDTF